MIVNFIIVIIMYALGVLSGVSTVAISQMGKDVEEEGLKVKHIIGKLSGHSIIEIKKHGIMKDDSHSVYYGSAANMPRKYRKLSITEIMPTPWGGIEIYVEG